MEHQGIYQEEWNLSTGALTKSTVKRPIVLLISKMMLKQTII
jgi:hypothetical protein